jgi:hypothetical protein
MGLIQAAPMLAKWISGDDKETPIVEKAMEIAQALTGQKGKSAVDAINSDPALSFEFQKAVLDNETELARISMELVRTVNKTMQTESQSEHWIQYSWRPFWGFVSAFSFLVLVIFVCVLAWRAITKADANAMAMIPQLVFNFTTLFAIPGAILGVTAWHRGKQKREQRSQKDESS